MVFYNAIDWNLDTRIHFPQKRIDRGYSHFWNICVYLLKKCSPEMFQGHNILTIYIYIWNLFFMKTIHNIEKYFNQFHVNLNRKVFFSPVQTPKIFHCSFLWEKLASSLSRTTSDILKDDSNKGVFGKGRLYTTFDRGHFFPRPPPHIWT